MSAPTRILLALTFLVVCAHVAFSATVYGDLPARIPTHFDAAGVADGFGPKSNWWLLTATSVVTTALLAGLVLYLPRNPDLLNIPNKAEMLALPPDGQTAVVHAAQPGMLLLGLMMAGVMLFLQYATWLATQGRSAIGMDSLIFILPIGSIAILPVLLIPVRRELRRQQEEHQRAPKRRSA